MQPAMPTLVREWLPSRIAIGTVAYTSGMLIGATFRRSLTLPYVLPLVGGSWRLDLAFWAIPALLIAPAVFAAQPAKPASAPATQRPAARLWWPDFGNPAVWLLGLSFGGNNSPFFAISAFLGDYLTSQGKANLLGPALAWLNSTQIVGLVLLFAMSGPAATAGLAVSDFRAAAARRLS